MKKSVDFRHPPVQKIHDQVAFLFRKIYFHPIKSGIPRIPVCGTTLALNKSVAANLRSGGENVKRGVDALFYPKRKGLAPPSGRAGEISPPRRAG
jgi:hypothetical protein